MEAKLIDRWILTVKINLKASWEHFNILKSLYIQDPFNILLTNSLKLYKVKVQIVIFKMNCKIKVWIIFRKQTLLSIVHVHLD